MMSSQKRGDNGGAGTLGLLSPAGVKITEALRTSKTAQGQNLQMFPSVVCKGGVLLQGYCFGCPFSLGVLLRCSLSSSGLRIAEFPGRAHQNGEDGLFLRPFLSVLLTEEESWTCQGKEFYNKISSPTE